MNINLSQFDWNSIGAISTFLAVIVALFYPIFSNRVKIQLLTSVCSMIRNNETFVKISVINQSKIPIWITSAAVIMKIENKKVVKLIGINELPKQLNPYEPFEFNNDFIDCNFDYSKNVYVKDSRNKFHFLSMKGQKNLNDQMLICIKNCGGIKRKEMKLFERPKF
jgi:hypothetical protein